MNGVTSVMFTVSPLAPEDAASGYPIARLIKPDLTLEDWRRYVGRQMRPKRSGIVAARSPSTVIFGLTPWWVRPDLECDTTLWTGPIIAIEPGAASQVHDVLLTALSALAVQHGCRSMKVVHPGDLPASPLPHLGLAWYGAVLQREIVPAEVAA